MSIVRPGVAALAATLLAVALVELVVYEMTGSMPLGEPFYQAALRAGGLCLIVYFLTRGDAITQAEIRQASIRRDLSEIRDIARR